MRISIFGYSVQFWLPCDSSTESIFELRQQPAGALKDASRDHEVRNELPGGIPCNGMHGKALPGRIPFSSFRYIYYRVGILQAEVDERVGKSVTKFFKRALPFNKR